MKEEDKSPTVCSNKGLFFNPLQKIALFFLLLLLAGCVGIGVEARDGFIPARWGYYQGWQQQHRWDNHKERRHKHDYASRQRKEWREHNKHQKPHHED